MNHPSSDKSPTVRPAISPIIGHQSLASATLHFRSPSMSVQSTLAFHPIPGELLPDAHRYRIQASAWFQGWLYLGVSAYPVDPGHSGHALLLRHRLRESGWEQVHSSPIESPWLQQNGQRRRFALELGWRALTVLPDPDQATPTLYALRLGLRAPALLHSSDGTHFQEQPNPGPTAQGPCIALRGCSGQVFAISVAAAHDRGCAAAPLWMCRDPRQPDWQPASAPGFGDPDNRTLDGLQVFNGQLYAATGNPDYGFQLWKSTVRGQPPFAWEQVLREGALRYSRNPRVETLVVFKDALYLGTRAARADATLPGDAGAEIIRVLADDRWELVMGTPRFSPLGLQVPLSSHGPGFGDARNPRITRLAATSEALYAALGRYRDPADMPTASAPLWKSVDGESWQGLFPPGCDSPAAGDPRILQATPHGLVIAGDWDTTRDAQARPGLWLDATH